LTGEQLIWPLTCQAWAARRLGSRLHISRLAVIFVHRYVEPNQIRIIVRNRFCFGDRQALGAFIDARG